MGIVMKYGGTSVATTEKINKIASYIKEIKQDKGDIVLVVSAMGKYTDQLINLAKEFGDDLPKREMDALLSTGEQQTIALFAIALRQLGVNAISLTGFQAGFQTTSNHQKSIIKDIDISRIKTHLEEGNIVVVAGFQGITKRGDITTLGRGGSDTSAVALAAKLGYPCEIYTDVDGIFTTDPRIVSNAKKIDQISYEEMMEMASLGSGVIETRAVELAKKYEVPLYIARSLSKEGSGTYIMNKRIYLEDKPITGISLTDHVSMITIEGTFIDHNKISKLYSLISEHNISLDMISQNIDHDGTFILSFSMSDDDIATFYTIQKDNPEYFMDYHIQVQSDLVKLSLVGVGMASSFGVASKVFQTLLHQKIDYYQISTSEISISVTINKSNKERAANALSTAFELQVSV